MIGNWRIRRIKLKKSLSTLKWKEMKRKKNIELVHVDYWWIPTAGLSSSFTDKLTQQSLLIFYYSISSQGTFFSQPCYLLYRKMKKHNWEFHNWKFLLKPTTEVLKKNQMIDACCARGHDLEVQNVQNLFSLPI